MIRLLSLLLVIGCRSLPANGQNECSAPLERRTGALPLDTLMLLTGKYRFIHVDTSEGTDRLTIPGELTLNIADTLERYYERHLRGFVRTGNRPLVGYMTWGPTRDTARAERVVVQQNPASTSMIRGFCTSCFDAMWVYYGIAEVRANRFSGRWHDPQTGIGKLVDEQGRMLPDPAGYYCAIRI